jgi:antitoxin YefM
MEIVQLKEFKENINNYFSLACDNKEEIFIKNRNRKLVLLDADEYESLIETLRIYRNSYLYQKILRAKKSGKDLIKRSKDYKEVLGEIGIES